MKSVYNLLQSVEKLTIRYFKEPIVKHSTNLVNKISSLEIQDKVDIKSSVNKKQEQVLTCYKPNAFIQKQIRNCYISTYDRLMNYSNTGTVYKYGLHHTISRNFSTSCKETDGIVNLDEYSSPEIYDAEYGGYIDDFNIFLNLKTQGVALDLACGTGRITIPLSKTGLKVIGIDANISMIERASKKSQGLPISYLRSDIRDFYLAQKFDLITMAGNSFQALLTAADQREMLKSVKEHLKEDGLFIFNTRNLQKEKLNTIHNFEYWHDFQDSRVIAPVRVFGKQLYNPENQIMNYTTKRVWPSYETVSEIKLRFTSYIELIKQLENSGFEIIEICGNVDKTPYHSTSPSIISLCRLK